jgi:hypothetical protein
MKRRLQGFFITLLSLWILWWSCAGIYVGVLSSPQSHGTRAWTVAAADEPTLFWAMAAVSLAAGGTLLVCSVLMVFGRWQKE